MLGSALVWGILLGMVYGLLGAGLNVIFGVVGVLNFAHGDFLMLAAFGTFWLNVLLRVDPLVSLLILMPLFFVTGTFLYYLTVPRLLKSEDAMLTSMLCYYGISLLLSGGAFLVWGATPRALQYPYRIISISVGGIQLPVSRVIAFIVVLLITLALLFFLYKTYVGKAVRAAIQNRAALELLGVNVPMISALTFGIGISLAATAGNMIALIYPSITYNMGLEYVLFAFAVIILGGLGNPIGALLGGLIFGIAENVCKIYLPSMVSPLLTFILLIIVIMLKPEGLLPRD